MVEDGRVGGLRQGVEDVAVRFWGVGLAGRFTRSFVGGPLASLTGGAAVFGTPAGAACASAWFRTRGIRADIGHDGMFKRVFN